MPLGSRLSDSIININLWEQQSFASTEWFSLKTLTINLKEIVSKYTSSYHSPVILSQPKMHKSSLQMLLDENALQASKPKSIEYTGSFLSSLFSNKRKTDNEPDLDLDWLDFAYKSSIDKESLSDDACYAYDMLNEMVNRMHTIESPSKLSMSNGKVAIIDFSNASFGDLQFLMQLFTGCSLDETRQYSFEEILQSLSTYIPLASIQTPKPPQNNESYCFSCNRFYFFTMYGLCCCQNCGRAFCSYCIVKRHVYQLNLPSLLDVCKSCCDNFDKQDAELWKEKCLSLIKVNDLQSLMAAHGCMAMALCSNINVNNLLYSVAKELTQCKFYASSLEFFTTSLFTSTDTDFVKTCVAIGSTLQSFADCPNTEYIDQLSLLMAANNAYTCAKTRKTKHSVEIPHLDENTKCITRKLYVAYNNEKEVYAKKAASKLETAWANRNCYDMMSVLLESDQGFGSHFEDYAMIGLEQFLVTKVKFIDTMCNVDSAAILFFQGILKVHKNDHTAGLSDLEKAVWKGYHSEWMPKASIDILIFMLSDSQFTIPHENLLPALKTFSSADLLSNESKCLTSLHLKPAQFVSPTTRHWPDLSVTGINSRATYKYEMAALKLFKEDKWTAKDVALAYIDFIPSHEHSAEVCVSFLLAGSWFLKELESVVYASQKGFHSKVYAIKQATFLCTELAFCASKEHFHLGMQLYASRVGLQIVLRTKECAQAYFTKDDSRLLSQLFKVVIQTSRFFPFWNIPIVMACEAPLLHLLTGKLHHEFVLSLQHIPSEKHMLFKDHELTYQLYENSVRHLCPLDNPDEAQLQAMNSMLTERGWSMEDVSYLMTSPLSSRSPDGWLIQQPKLGVSMEFASIEGFVLDLENPSLQLLVVKADKKNAGLVSQNDLSECLQLPNGPLFFSLDPPDEDYRYHPFQAFRYEPKELQGSTLLHTMFETDYLMKSFSVGTEVSSVPPFKQRSCKEGLLAKLPRHLQNALRPMFERGQSQSHMQRFWIQADQIKYDETINNGKLTIKVKKPKITIRNHPQMIGTDGKLKDTSGNVNTNSPEFKFATDLTTYYDEIGKHFPMFARLQEIVKLWFLSRIIQNKLQEFKDKAQGEYIVPTHILEDCQERDRQEKLNSLWKNLSEIKERYKSLYGHVDYQLDFEMEIARQLANTFNGDQHTIQRLVDQWLGSSYTSFRSSNDFYSVSFDNWLQLRQYELCDYLCNCLPQISSYDIKKAWQPKFQREYSLFSDLVDKLKGPDVKPKLPANFCNWVPAALFDKNNGSRFCFCYGGVLITPTPIVSSVSMNPGYVQKTVGQRQPSDSRKYYQNSPPTKGAAIPKQTYNTYTSTRNNSNGATCFPFKVVLKPSQTNVPLTQLQLKDKLTQIVSFKSQRNPNHLISHPDKPQRNVQMQNNSRARTNAQRTIINSRRKIFQMQSRGMHGQAGSSGGQRNSGGQKGRSSLAAAGFGAGAVLGAGGGGGDDSSGDDSDSDTTKYMRWSSVRWTSSKEGSYMQPIPAYSHIPYRNVSYIGTKLDGKDMWISLHPSGYKFNAWKVQYQDKDTLKLKLDSQFNANGKKTIKEEKKGE